jgi:phage tail sheath gpL-like
MVIAFDRVASDRRVPLFTAEFDPGLAPYSNIMPTVIIGHKLSGGTAPTGAMTNLGGADPNALFGQGSMLAAMAAYAREHDPLGDIRVLPIAEPAGDPAVATIALTGPASASGTLVLYIEGERVSVPVASGASAASVASALTAAINAGFFKFNRQFLFGVAATVSSGTITLTARHAGVVGNAAVGGFRIEQGLVGDERDVPGIGVTITQAASGTGEVDMAAALALLGDSPANVIIAPFSSTTQLDAVGAFLSDSGSGRWSPDSLMYGHYVTAKVGNLTAQTTFGVGRNDRHASVVGVHNPPHPVWCWAGAFGGAIARSKNLGAPLSEALEIVRPMQTVALKGLRAPKAPADRWSLADRQSLYGAGISAYHVRADGSVAIDRALTLYQRTVWGNRDETFMEVSDIMATAYIGLYFRALIEGVYPRHALRDENPGNLQGVVTPRQARATIMHGYNKLFQAGIVEKPDVFAQYLIVERSTNPRRLNAYLPVDLTNQLIVFAAKVAIFSEYDAQTLAAANA